MTITIDLGHGIKYKGEPLELMAELQKLRFEEKEETVEDYTYDWLKKLGLANDIESIRKKDVNDIAMAVLEEMHEQQLLKLVAVA